MQLLTWAGYTQTHRNKLDELTAAEKNIGRDSFLIEFELLCSKQAS